MKRHRFLAGVFAGVLVLGALSAEAMICVKGDDAYVRHVDGVVILDDEHSGESPLPGAKVAVKRGEYEKVEIADEKGQFSFPRLPQGNYEMRVELEGFQSHQGKVFVRKTAPRDKALVVSLTIDFNRCTGLRAADRDEIPGLD